MAKKTVKDDAPVQTGAGEPTAAHHTPVDVVAADPVPAPTGMPREGEYVGWWFSYRNPKTNVTGLVMGWLLPSENPDIVRVASHVKEMDNAAGVGHGGIVEMARENIQVEGPVMLGRKVSKADHEAWKAAQEAEPLN